MALLLTKSKCVRHVHFLRKFVCNVCFYVLFGRFISTLTPACTLLDSWGWILQTSFEIIGKRWLILDASILIRFFLFTVESWSWHGCQSSFWCKIFVANLAYSLKGTCKLLKTHHCCIFWLWTFTPISYWWLSRSNRRLRLIGSHGWLRYPYLWSNWRLGFP